MFGFLQQQMKLSLRCVVSELDRFGEKLTQTELQIFYGKDLCGRLINILQLLNLSGFPPSPSRNPSTQANRSMTIYCRNIKDF